MNILGWFKAIWQRGEIEQLRHLLKLQADLIKQLQQDMEDQKEEHWKELQDSAMRNANAFTSLRSRLETAVRQAFGDDNDAST